MTTRVSTEGQVSINDESYRILRPEGGEDGRVHRFPTSRFAPKTVIGDVDGSSYPNTSVIKWNDWRGGVGKAEITEREDILRNRFTFFQTSFPGHLTLGRLFTFVNSDPTNEATLLGEHNSVIYGTLEGGTDVFAYDNGGDSWDSKLHDLPAAATDVLSSFRMAGSEYIAWATTGGYTYTSDGSSYTDDTTDAKHLAFWDDRLWGIDNTGQLWFASTIGTETNDAQLPLPDGFVTSLFVGRDALGEKILYAGTKRGLYAHDAANARFVETEIIFPEHPNGGEGASSRGGFIYIPRGQSLLEYQPSTGNYRNIGLDLDNGLPGLYEDASIAQVVTTPTELFVRTVGTNDRRFVAKWNGIGWEFWSSTTLDYNWLHISNAYGGYRLWLSIAQAAIVQVGHFPLFASEIDPDENSDMTYFAGSTSPNDLLDTPWFTAGESELDKLAVRLQIETNNPTSSETVQVLYALDYATISLTADTNFTDTGTITTSGKTTYNFQTSSANKGTAFRAIKFRVKFARGATTTNTPDLRSLTLEYRKKLPAKWGFTVDLDTSESIEKRTPETQLDDLRTAFESNPMVELAYRDRDDNAENYFVEIQGMDVLEETGHEYGSRVRISATEI